MNDQLSKVVRCQVCGESEPFSGACGSSDPRALCKSGRIESAAASVEVELPEPTLHYHDGVGLVPAYTVEQVATLARQLAEAKEQRDALVSEYERAVGCGEQGYVHALMHLFNAITNAKIDTKVVERQLAAATRRVAEVEAERDELRQAAHGLRFDVFSLTTNELQATFDGKQSIAVVDMDTVAALKSALQKEPK